MEGIKSFFRQTFSIPAAPLTEANLPSQHGRVMLVTGGNTGIGLELCKILYSANATVWVAGRNPEKCNKAIADIKAAYPDSKGSLAFLQVDLADLSSIKKSAETFTKQSSRLDVLFNNAGVMAKTKDDHATTKQGYEMQLGTNALGPYLFTKLLRPVLTSTAATSPSGSVRVTWAGSVAIDILAPPGGVRFDKEGNVTTTSNELENYGASKAGNVILANDFAKETQGSGIVTVCFNPGNLRTPMSDPFPTSFGSRMFKASGLEGKMFADPIFGSYTQLYCAFSSELTVADNGSFIIPWGRKSVVNSKLAKGIEKDGLVEKYMKWVNGEVAQYS